MSVMVFISHSPVYL